MRLPARHALGELHGGVVIQIPAVAPVEGLIGMCSWPSAGGSSSDSVMAEASAGANLPESLQTGAPEQAQSHS